MINKDNNFDIIRLLITIQVVYQHVIGHLHPDFGNVGELIYRAYHFFPSLPIFFLISGFLVSMSLERAKSIRHYFINRALKLYPALWVFFSLSIICITITGYWQTSGATFGSVLTWLIAQISFVQVYNPDFMRGFGVGVINGSLWTLTAEIQFYLLLPVLYFFIKNTKKIWSNTFLALLIFVFSCISIIYSPVFDATNMGMKLYKVSCIPYLYMILIGIFIQRNFSFFKRLVEDKALIWLCVYMMSFFLLGGMDSGKSIHMCLVSIKSIFLFIVLSLTVFSCVFSYTKLSHRLLKGYDITYGTYIYHMLIINLFVEYSLRGNFGSMLMVYLLTFLLALISWVYIEKPALGLKKHVVKKIDGVPAGSAAKYMVELEPVGE